MFMNACNIYITYLHHYQSMSSINYTHFIIFIINNKHVHIYITSFNIINHSVNPGITSQGLHSTKQYTNRHTNRKLHIIELSRKITKQKFHTHAAIRVSYDPYASIRVSPYLIRVSYANHQNTKWPRDQPIRVSACHTRITRDIFLFPKFHTRISLAIRVPSE